LQPRRISNRVVAATITGYFMPTRGPNVPVLIGMVGTDDLFILVFSTREKLDGIMRSLGIAYERLSIVTSGPDLLDEIKSMNARADQPYEIRLAIDLHDGVGIVCQVAFGAPLAEFLTDLPHLIEGRSGVGSTDYWVACKDLAKLQELLVRVQSARSQETGGLTGPS